MRYLFHLAFILLFSTLGFGQNLNMVDASYLKEGGQILTEFYSFNTTDDLRWQYKLQFFKKYNIKYSSEKVKSLRYESKKVTKRFINAFDRLHSTDKKFFEELNNLTGEAESGKALYYKITNYWLLPAQFARRIIDWNDLVNEEGYVDLWAVEQRFDEAVLLFLSKKGYLKNFKNFENLARTANIISPDYMGPEIKKKMLDKFKAKKENHADLMYVRSKSMLALIEGL